MTLNETLLQKLSEWNPTGPGRHVLAALAPEAGWTATITADRADASACVLWDVALTRTGAVPAGLTLRSWAEQAAKRIMGLLEPLSVYEIDDSRGEAILRSQAPTQRAGQLGYYEVLLRGTASATLRRFSASNQPGSHRQQVAFALTHEALAKVAEDLTASV
jgi:hypothetical protein